MPRLYKCERCGFKNQKKQILIDHLTNDCECMCIYSNVTRAKCIEDITNKKYKNLKVSHDNNILDLKRWNELLKKEEMYEKLKQEIVKML